MRFARVLGITAVVLLMTGCAAQAESPAEPEATEGGTLRVGVIVPLSGPFAREGEEVKRGYELALAESDGKIAGKTVELIVGDAFAPEDTMAEVDRLATLENVDLFIATYASPASQAGSEAAARYGLPWIETHATTDSLTTRGLENYFRTTARAVDFAEASAEFVVDGLAPELGGDISVYIEHEDGPYGTAVSETQIAKLEEAGISVTVGSHKAAATDVTDSILAAKAADPDVWLNTGYVADSSLLLRTAAANGFRPPAMVLNGAGDSRAVWEAVGEDDLTGVFVTAYTSRIINPEYAPGAEAFLTAYEEEYGELPSDSVASVGYSGMAAARILIEQAEGSVEVADLAAAAEEVDVPMGGLPIGWGLRFDADQQNERIRMAIVQWRSDATTPAVWPEEAAVSGEGIELE